MKYSYILVTIVGIGLLVSNFYFFQENSKLGNQIIEDNENFTKMNNALDELNTQYEIGIDNLQTEIESLEGLLAGKEVEISHLNDENQNLIEQTGELVEKLSKFEEINTYTEGFVRVTLHNISFEYSENLIASVSGLHLGDETDRSGIFIATSDSLDHVISLSWEKVESLPNLTEVIVNAYDSFGVVLGMNTSSMVNKLGQEVLYASYIVSDHGVRYYFVVSTWFDELNETHFVLVIQDYKPDVVEQLEEFLSSYRNINSN